MLLARSTRISIDEYRGAIRSSSWRTTTVFRRTIISKAEKIHQKHFSNLNFFALTETSSITSRRQRQCVHREWVSDPWAIRRLASPSSRSGMQREIHAPASAIRNIRRICLRAASAPTRLSHHTTNPLTSRWQTNRRASTSTWRAAIRKTPNRNRNGSRGQHRVMTSSICMALMRKILRTWRVTSTNVHRVATATEDSMSLFAISDKMKLRHRPTADPATISRHAIRATTTTTFREDRITTTTMHVIAIHCINRKVIDLKGIFK